MNKTPRVLIYTDIESNFEYLNSDFTFKILSQDLNFFNDMNHFKPNVIITICNDWKFFSNLSHSDSTICNKWIHYDILPKSEQLINEIYNCYFYSITNSLSPLISIFTTTFNSGDKIKRPHKSLLKQSYDNWEWIIMDDSNDNSETLEMLKVLKNNDQRIRLYKRDNHSGSIGEVKNEASNLSRGEYIVELDHDDELTENCLEEIVNGFKNNPEVGFIYTDFSEIYYPSMKNFKYEENWAFGFGAYRKVLHNKQWVNVACSAPINQFTIQNIVGVPNHVRCWRKQVLVELGGYNIHLPIADDYELSVRTFLKTKMMRLPFLGYIQYKNENNDNFSIIRNKEITKLQERINLFYQKEIFSRLEELDLIIDTKFCLNWYRNYNEIIPHCIKFPNNEDTISVIIPTYNRKTKLLTAMNSVFQQNYMNWKLYIIGDNCPILDEFMESLNIDDTRIEWWNLESNHGSGGAIPRNYALRMLVNTKWVAYLDDDNYWEFDHLNNIMELLNKNPDATYGFSSFIIDEETHILATKPLKYRIDTSAIVHDYNLLIKYGYWKTQQEAGYAHDWELVSRWGKETYVATEKFTLHYDSQQSGCNAQEIYNYYNDQPSQDNILNYYQ